MRFEHEFYLSLPIDKAWAVVTDIERIAPCMPGAQLEEANGDSYKGSVKVRVGPITTQYRGTAVIVEKDAAARRMVLDGKGADSFGQGNAAAAVVGLLHDEGERTRVTLTTDLQISGKVAQLGQGVMKDVSAKLLKQFVTNLEKKLSAEGPPVAATPEPSPQPAASPAPVSGTASPPVADASVAGHDGNACCGGRRSGIGGIGRRSGGDSGGFPGRRARSIGADNGRRRGDRDGAAQDRGARSGGDRHPSGGRKRGAGPLRPDHRSDHRHSRAGRRTAVLKKRAMALLAPGGSPPCPRHASPATALAEAAGDDLRFPRSDRVGKQAALSEAGLPIPTAPNSPGYGTTDNGY
jgi:carbon monoxide dehydrogenase subunit G